MEGLECSQDVPHYNHMGLSVAIEAKVCSDLALSLMQPFTHPMISIGLLGSEIFMFESVNGWTHGWTGGRWLESYPIGCPWTFGLGKLNPIVYLSNILFSKVDYTRKTK